MRFKSALISIATVCLLTTSIASFALKVTLINSSKTNIQSFKLPNNVSYGPVNQSQRVDLPSHLTKQLANKTGDVAVVFDNGEQHCGTVTFYNGKTSIEIKELSENSINCSVSSHS